MSARETLTVLLLLPALGFFVVLIIIRAKEKARAAFLRRFDGVASKAGAAKLDGRTYERRGRAFTIDANVSPLFSRNLSLRLALIAPGAYEFEIKRAQNVPVTPPPRLASDPFYRAFSVEGMVRPELEDFLLRPDVRRALESTLPGRWDAVSQFYVERVLYHNRFAFHAYAADDLARDLDALAVLADAPPARVDREGFFAFRSGFEPHPWPWHWTAEARAKLPPGLTRACFAAYFDSPLLNDAALGVLRKLSGGPLTFLPAAEVPDAVRRAYGEAIDPVAADRFMDGLYFGAAVAGAAPPALAEAPSCLLHERAIGVLGDVLFYARRLRDDENSWFTGEIEILSTKLDAVQIEAAVREAAQEHESSLRLLESPFTPKLLKQDRLEVSS